MAAVLIQKSTEAQAHPPFLGDPLGIAGNVPGVGLKRVGIELRPGQGAGQADQAVDVVTQHLQAGALIRLGLQHGVHDVPVIFAVIPKSVCIVIAVGEQEAVMLAADAGLKPVAA